MCGENLTEKVAGLEALPFRPVGDLEGPACSVPDRIGCSISTLSLGEEIYQCEYHNRYCWNCTASSLRHFSMQNSDRELERNSDEATVSDGGAVLQLVRRMQRYLPRL